MSKSILFVVNNFNIGGPQKSLLSLLHNFPKEVEVDLLILNKENLLIKYLPKNVRVISESNNIPLLMVNKSNIIKNIIRNGFNTPIFTFNLLKLLIASINKKNLTQEKQAFWVKNAKYIKSVVNIKYDYAVAVSGGHSMMYVVDYVNASNKVGWIRTEYQNLQRNLQIDKIYFEKLNLILSVSSKCTDKFLELFPNEKDKVKTFYNPLPYVMYQNLFKNINEKLPEKTEVLIELSTISRLDKDKGFDLIIDAAYKMKNKGYSFVWNIYGIGPIYEELTVKIKDKSLEKYLILKGFEFNTGKILSKTDILVHASKFEGKSNTIDEAKYFAVPIVSTNFPTVSEQLVNEKNAIITEMDSDSLLKGVETMIINQELRMKIIKNLKSEQDEKREVYQEFMAILEGRDKGC